jgi:acyl-CoA reductase-like NAD-dependent aldehyde dehydrogenase
MAQMYIEGKWIGSEEGQTLPAINPSNSEVLETFPKGTKADAQKAIDAAVASRSKAEDMTAYERSKILLKVAQLLEQNSAEMSKLIAQNVGKPIGDSEAETARGVLTLTFAAEEAKRLYGQTIPLDSHPFPPGNKNRLGFTIREPIGVVGAISPFNFPLNLLLHKVAPAIAVGNTVVAKPPSDGPLPGIFIAKLFEQAGLPPGILNVVTGSGSEVGMEIVTSSKVDAVSFTGDTATGRLIAEKAAATNKKTILELGGHDPMMILDDADLAKAAKSAVVGVFGYSGQVCTATKRLIVEDKAKEPFLKAFSQEVQKLKIGNALERTTNVGPVINMAGLEKIKGLVDDAVNSGAVLVQGGSRLQSPEYSKGFFFAPTILDEVKPDMAIGQKEIFGPVAPLIEAGSDEEAISVANGTIYGLQASIFTTNMARGLRLAKRIKAGAVLINDRTNVRWDNAPFGGIKRSGLGREGVSLAVTELTELKFIVANLEA